MLKYSSDSSENSDDSETPQTWNPIKTLDLTYSSLNTESAAKQFENVSKCSNKRKETIETILLFHNELDLLPANILSFCNVKTLDIGNNRITCLPESLSKLPLLILIVRNNCLTSDGLPKSFAQFHHLKVCNLSGNSLSTFPAQVLEANTIEYLYLGNNRIAQVPNQIDALRRLKVLCLGGNNLSEIPESVGCLINLRGLILSDNCLETLPASIANLKNLKSLLLHKNRLRTLPTEIVALKCLSELSLRDNPLVMSFVNDMQHNPPSLLELAGRVIKLHNIDIPEDELPYTLRNYLKSAHRCVNPKCKGVFFDNRVEHIKFVDFCGKYRVPLLQFLCSSKCMVNNTALHGSYADSAMLRKVLLG